MSRAKNPPNKPTPHGTDNGYKHYGCRCAECREAHRVYGSRHCKRLCLSYPLAPFRNWLRQQCEREGSIAAAARALGCDDRAIRRWLNDPKATRVYEQSVDRVLTRAGSHITEVYQ